MHPAFVDQPSPDFLRWTEPLIADVVSAGYTQLVADHNAMAAVVRCNVLVWRNLLAKHGNTDAFVRELLRLSHRAGVDARSVERINELVVDELMAVIAGRYSRSPRQAAGLSFEVASAACRLTRAFSLPPEPLRSQPRQMELAKRGA